MREESLTLYQLSCHLSQLVKQGLPDSYWVEAEISELRVNSSGHCYMECIEKSVSGAIIAKVKATVWAKQWHSITESFTQQAGIILQAGLKVLMRVHIDYHPLYGMSIQVQQLDPTYTVGDLQRQRQEILLRLEKEGVLELNKQLAIATVAQRIAVISSATAAGWGDFFDQMSGKYRFDIQLFPAIMQGEQAPDSIINALDTIATAASGFDIVVIIRGGGATSDLHCFDHYELAATCAQFPIPIIVGIGHERDVNVLDYIAAVSLKTPTAVAAYLVDKMEQQEALLHNYTAILIQATDNVLTLRKQQLESYSYRLITYTKEFTGKQHRSLDQLKIRLGIQIPFYFQQKRQQLELMEQRIKLNSPQAILEKGYSITTHNGRIVSNTDSLSVGDEIQTRLKDIIINSTINKI